MNVVNLYGRLTREVEIRYCGDRKSTAIAEFTLAVRGYDEHTNFIRCKAFNAAAEILEKYAYAKGTRLAVTGEWIVDSYTNKEGDTVYSNECVVNKVYLIETRDESEDRESEDRNGRNNKRSSNSGTRGKRTESK